MPRTEKYFIGPQLLGDIRRVVGRVDAEPIRSGVSGIPTRLQDMPRRGGGAAAKVKLGTFSGAWPVGTEKEVSLYHSGETSTVTVTNFFCPAGASCAPAQWCAVFQDGGGWYLLAASCGS
jgi:hypothetical protein